MMIISPPFKVGKKYPKCKLRLKKGVFEGGPKKKMVSLHFEGVLKTLPTKTTPGDVQRPILHLRGGLKTCILHFGMVPP